MLIITLRDGRGLEWHTGEALPGLHLEVVSISADCDELGYIERNFSNIPMVRNKCVVTWRGEVAQFIVDNLTMSRR